MDTFRSLAARLKSLKGWAIGGYILAVTLAIYFAFSHWSSDDPFITFRYADNLRRGLGFVYNPGERVLSTTTPLFTLLLAGLGFVWREIPHLAILLNAFGLALGGFFLWDMAHSWKTPLVGWAGLLLYPTFPLLLTTLGAETTLYLAFCLGAFAFYARRNLLLTATFTALAVLTRPDGALIGMVLVAHFLLERVRGNGFSRADAGKLTENNFSRNPWLAVLLFLDLILPWFVFTTWYFGSPLPATLATKQLQGSMTISQQFAPGFLTIAGYYAVHWRYRFEALLAVVGVVALFGWARRWLPFFSWTALYFLAYSLLGVSRYSWYYAPLVPAFIVLVGLGLSFIAHPPFFHSPPPSRSQSQSLFSPASSASFLLRSLTVLLLLFFVVAQLGDLLRIRQKPDARYSLYRAAGEWLQANTNPSDSIGALEIGIIGYYAHRPMVDFAGLLQPLVADRLRGETTYENAALWAVERYHPSYLALIDGHFPRLEQGYVVQFCTLAQRFLGEDFDYSANLSIYACQR